MTSIAAPRLDAVLAAVRGDRLDLRALLGSTLVRADRVEVMTWVSGPASLHFDPADLLDRIAMWESRVGALAEDDTRTLVTGLRALARTGAGTIAYSCTSREKHGGRRQFWFVPHYTGAVVLTADGAAALRGRRHLLQATPRFLRPAFRGAPGHLLVDVDLVSAFLAAAGALTGDGQLLADLAKDVHQIIGDHLCGAGEPDAERRRAAGKAVNQIVLCAGGGGAWTLRERWAEQGIPVDEQHWQAVIDWWWARYPALRALRDSWWDRCHRAQTGMSILRPDGDRYRFAKADLDGGHPDYDHLPKGLERARAAFRSTWSSIWRAIESAILDRVLALLVAMRDRRVRLVVPMYDGVLLAVSQRDAGALVPEIEALVERACAEAGVTARAKAKVGLAWPM